MSWLRRNGIRIYGALAIAYMLIPIVVIAIFSFNDPEGKFNFTWNGFTLDHWRSAFSLPDLNEAFVTSLTLAALATAVATVLGTMIALALVRYQFLGRRAANFLIVLPLATPEVVIGAALLSMFVYFEVARGFWTLFIAHVMFSISFVVIVVRSRLIGFDRSIEEAARDLGASTFETFRLITLPLIMPGVLGGALLAFALSLDDFVISNFTSGREVTFPLFIFGASQRGIPVEVNVIATILFVVTVVAMVVVVRQQRRAEELASMVPDDESAPGPLGPGALPASSV
jgi:spermidine/putrescine transport system permease protein